MAVRQVIGRDVGALAEFLNIARAMAGRWHRLNPIDLAGGQK